METLFALGTFWFWALMVSMGFLIVIATELEDTPGWQYLILIGLPVLLYFTGCKEEIIWVLTFIRDTPLTALALVMAYLTLGLVWSVMKWWIYLIELTSQYDKHDYANKGYISDKFKAVNNSDKIINWMMYWPLSIIWFILSYPLKNLFKGIFKLFIKQFDDIQKVVVNRIYKKID